MAGSRPKSLNYCEDENGSASRFKFQTIKQRAEHEDVDIIHKVRVEGYLNEEAEAELGGEENGAAAGCFFREELDRLWELHRQPKFRRFYYSVWPMVQSLPELLHNLPRVLPLLTEQLDGVEGSHIEPIMQLIAVLARDLRSEFYPHFHTVILALLQLLRPDIEPEQAAGVLRTFGFLLKYLAPNLIEDIGSLKQYYGQLLGHRREFVRDYSAKTLTSVVRRLKNKALRKHLRSVLKATETVCTSANEVSDTKFVRRRDQLVDGVARLMFHCCKGLKHKLHSKAKALVQLMLETDLSPGTKADSGEWIHQSVTKSLQLIIYHIHPGEAGVLWEMLHLQISHLALEGPLENNDERFRVTLIRAISLVKLFAQEKRGLLLKHQENIESQVQPLATSLTLLSASGECPLQFAELLKVVWPVYPNHTALLKHLPDMLQKIGTGGSPEIVSILCELLTDLPKTVAYNYLFPILVNIAVSKKDQSPVLSVWIMKRLTCCTGKINCISMETDPEDDFTQTYPRLVTQQPPVDVFIAFCVEYLEAIESDAIEEEAARIAATIHCIPSLVKFERAMKDRFDCTRVFEAIDSFAQKVVQLAKSSSSETLHALAMEAILPLACWGGKKIWFESVLQVLMDSIQRNPSQLSMLRAYCSILDAVKSCSFISAELMKNILSKENGEALANLMLPNLRSRRPHLRLYSLRLLSQFQPLSFLEPKETSAHEGNTFTGTCNVVDICLELEELPVSLKHEREIERLLGKLEVYGRCQLLPPTYALLIASACVGLLSIKFQPLWNSARKAFRAVTGLYPKDAWRSIFPALKFHNQLFPNQKTELCESLKKTDKSEVLDELAAITLKRSFYCHNQMDEADNEKVASLRDIIQYWDKGILEDTILDRELEPGEIERGLSTDNNVIHKQLWLFVRDNPVLLETNSKEAVPLLFDFLESAYNSLYPGDPDLREMGLAGKSHLDDSETTEELSKSVNTRLFSYLEAFSAVRGPKQLYKSTLLKHLWECLLAKPMKGVPELALACLKSYKLPYLTPYMDHVEDLLVDTKLRDTLLMFEVTKDSGVLMKEHRPQFLPLLSRLLYGRFLAKGMQFHKANKQGPAARRSAILSFLASLEDEELDSFIFMMVRAFIPRGFDYGTISEELSYAKALDAVQSVTAEEIVEVVPTRSQGFLNTLGNLTTQMGTKCLKYLPLFLHLIINMIQAVQICAEKQKSEKEKGLPAHLLNLRSIALKRLQEIAHQFAPHYDFSVHASALWEALLPELRRLSGTCAGSEKAPSLLLLCRTLAIHPRLCTLIQVNLEVVTSVLDIISRGAAIKRNVVSCVLDIIDALLDFEGGTVIKPYLKQLVNDFTMRFGENLQDTKAGSKLTFKDSSIESKELSILTKISDHAAAGEFDSETVSRLVALLMPFLKPKTKAQDQAKVNILQIYATLLPRLDNPLKYITFLSRQLGPSGTNAGVAANETVRKQLLAVLQETVCHPKLEGFSRTMEILNALNARVQNALDIEYDFEKIIPAFGALAGEQEGIGWVELVEKVPLSLQLVAPLPILYHCLYSLHDQEVSVRSVAVAALKRFITIAVKQSSLSKETNQDPWQSLITTSLVPGIRLGVGVKDSSIRKGFISVLGWLVTTVADASEFDAPYTDLQKLMTPDNMETDFFQNVAHIQAHRRQKALHKVRTLLQTAKQTDGKPAFCMGTLTHILLPLALHAIYEPTGGKKIQNALPQEACETVGAIASHLSWSHYNESLKKLMSSLTKADETQEKFYTSAICSILDNFHFEVKDPDVLPEIVGNDDMMLVTTQDDENDLEKDGSQTNNTSSDSSQLCKKNMTKEDVLWKGLTTKLIPQMKALMTKETYDRHGAKQKALRAPVALALLKLIRRLPQRILDVHVGFCIISVVNALKSKDRDMRDTARKTLAKMTTELGAEYLGRIFSEMDTILSEGYQVHVKLYTVHFLLLALEKEYKPPESMPTGVDNLEDLRNKEASTLIPELDRFVSELMPLIMDDIFGKLRSEKSTEGHMQSGKIKEAQGQKGMDCLELLAKMILFRPTYAQFRPHEPYSVSATHAMVSPVLAVIQDTENVSDVGKASEALHKIVLGLTKNISAKSQEVLLYAHATIKPLLQSNPEEVFEANKPDVWMPSNAEITNAKEAQEAKKSQEKQNIKVIDGASAPKLTGWARKQNRPQGRGAGVATNPGARAALTFGLQLLHAALKRGQLHHGRQDSAIVMMADPFIPLLTTCLQSVKHTPVILLSLKCLGLFLRWDLPSLESGGSESLGKAVLYVLTHSNAATSTKGEMIQGCFQALALLMQYDENSDGKPLALPLEQKQLRALVALLQTAVLENDANSAAFGLVKVLIERKIMVPEIYDLMEKVFEIAIRSHRAGSRTSATGIFAAFLLNYPLGDKRFHTHLQQLVGGISYAFEEGRLSAITMLTTVIQRLPVPVLDEQAQFFFLPMTLRLVNDQSLQCRRSLSKGLQLLARRVSGDTFHLLLDYVLKWLGQDPGECIGAIKIPESVVVSAQELLLKRTAAQLAGLLALARPDLLKRGDYMLKVLQALMVIVGTNPDNIEVEIDEEADCEVLPWEPVYHSLTSIEKIYTALPAPCEALFSKPLKEFTQFICECLVFPHAWVSKAASRFFGVYFSRRDPGTLQYTAGASGGSCQYLKMEENVEYLTEKMCKQLNQSQEEEGSLQIIKNLVFLGRALSGRKEEVTSLARLFKRMAHMAKPKGEIRRCAVFKWFAAMATCLESPDSLKANLLPVVTALHRATVDGQQEEAEPGKQNSAEIAQEVMELLERKCGAAFYLQISTEVKKQFADKRLERKRAKATEALVNPQLASKRKLERNAEKRLNKKRKIQKMAQKRAQKRKVASSFFK